MKATINHPCAQTDTSLDDLIARGIRHYPLGVRRNWNVCVNRSLGETFCMYQSTDRIHRDWRAPDLVETRGIAILLFIHWQTHVTRSRNRAAKRLFLHFFFIMISCDFLFRALLCDDFCSASTRSRLTCRAVDRRCRWLLYSAPLFDCYPDLASYM